VSAWTGKRCAGCDGRKGKAYANRKFCGRCTIAVRKANKEAAWAAYLQRTYGITKAEYDALYEYQGGLCALCRRATGKSKRLSVDHDHSDGKVRGLLCSTCNKILGHARDSAAFFGRGMDYLIDPPFSRLQRQEKRDGFYEGTA
jgi:hypothetical protein